MRKKIFQRTLLSASIAMAAVSQSALLHAQSALSLEEIVVTAQKREQSLQDVGITINAFDGEAMEAMGVVNSNEIAAKTPNLNIMSPAGEGGVVSVFIRGIGLNDFALNNTGPVGFYVDESSVGSSNGQLTTLFDIDRVEVLKGPQGTLFGRNTTGGALNIVSKRPTEELEGSLKLTAGNYGYLKTEGVVSGALADNLNGRLALVTHQMDGYQKNLANGDEVEKKNYAGRVLLDYFPSDDLSLYLNLHASRNDSDSDLYGRTDDADFYEGNVGDKDYRLNVDTQGVSVKAVYDINDEVTLTSVSSYDDLDKLQQEDGDMLPFELIEFDYGVDTHTFSQELRLNGSTDRMNWIAGLYYLSETINWDVTLHADDLAIPGLSVAPLGTTNTAAHQELTTQAVFGQVEYELSEKWALTVGARYTQLEVDFEYGGSIPGLNGFVGGGGLQSSIAFSDDLTNEEMSGKIALNYYASDQHMIYGSITKGFKGGGFNGGAVSDFANFPDFAEYDPETVIAYELGIKSDLLDSSLRVNAAFFYYDYQDAQVFNSIADPITALPQNQIENAKKLELYGLDMDVTWQPTEALFIQAGVGYTHSEFDDYDLTVPTGGAPGFVDMSGVTPQNTPEWSANLLANYSWFLDGGSRVSAQIDGSYQSEVFYTNGTVAAVADPSSYTRNKEVGQESYSIWNARVSWTDDSESLELALWGKNLTDKEYAAYMFELSGTVGADQVMRGTPRTYGVDVKYHF